MVKKIDFLSHVKAAAPAVHAKITSHPDFDAKKHNSLRDAMKLDGGMTDDECTDVFGSIMNSDMDKPTKDRLIYGDGGGDGIDSESDDDAPVDLIDPEELVGSDDDDGGDDDIGDDLDVDADRDRELAE